jgi:hypothetical protein
MTHRGSQRTSALAVITNGLVGLLVLFSASACGCAASKAASMAPPAASTSAPPELTGGLGLTGVPSPEAARANQELFAAVAAAGVSLAQGLALDATHGRPIAAWFDLEDAKLELWVRTMKDGKFFNVGVDPDTGRVAGTVAITGGEELAEAEEQAKAMRRATTASLKTAVERVEAGHPGYRALSIWSLLDEGPEASVHFGKNAEEEIVTEPLR